MAGLRKESVEERERGAIWPGSGEVNCTSVSPNASVLFQSPVPEMPHFHVVFSISMTIPPRPKL